MIAVNNLYVQFSGIDLFKGISFVINKRDKIGLVGKNGVGKSTLMKIIAGLQKPESGTVTIPEGISVGYLPQEIDIKSDKSVYEETLTVFDDIKKIEEEIAGINKDLSERTDYESDGYISLINLLTEKHEQLHLSDNDKIAGEAEKILKGLGFHQDELNRPLSTFSGGWQMRVALAKLLLKSPSLLLLDEPTNHLDIASIIWLEETFKNYPGAILMVSHDRMFLDKITNRTIEIVFGKTYDYKVSYTKYVILREERLEQQRVAYQNQQNYIAQKERFIERFKAKNTKAKQAQSMMKQLEKIERITFDEIDTSSIQFHFPPAPRSGDIVIRAKNAAKSYGEKTVLKDIDFTIKRGDRIAFVGQNGQGKTTLVKMIVGSEKYKGDLVIGHNVETGYYAQVQEGSLAHDISVIKTIENIATGDWSKTHKIRGLLGAFLFGPDDIDKKVGVLSGGEKSRLALAKLLLKPYNLLILDEPTNHLDIASKEVLKNALLHYNGTLILVSHDRDFLEGLTNRTFEFKNQNIKEHIGDITDFLKYHELETFRQFELLGKKEKKESNSKKRKSTEDKTSYQKNEKDEKEIKKLKNAISKAEKNIAAYEKEISDFDKVLEDPEKYKTVLHDREAFTSYETLKIKLEKEMVLWESLSLKLEGL